MKQRWSEVGKYFAGGSGIEELMEDLGHALAQGGSGLRMLGGGNPALIPEMEALWRKRIQEILATRGEWERLLGVYDPPKGNSAFIQSVVEMLRQSYGWDIGPDNVAVMPGGQSAFFCLFSLLAGPAGASSRKILLPIVPEYIGYANQGMGHEIFTSRIPHLGLVGEHEFRYEIDFSHLEMGSEVAAVCLSRPTNPSGNLVPDSDIGKLVKMTEGAGVPLILDNAYGLPFPGILYRPASAWHADHVVNVFSLSKIGLPGTRTAVVVGPPGLIRSLTSMNAVLGLANSNLGQALTGPLLANGELQKLCETVVRPFYQRKMEHAREALHHFLPEGNWRVHERGGAMFLWLWIKGMKVSSKQFYQILKDAGVLVVPGEYFFFGLPDGQRGWDHQRECLRLSFAMDDMVVEQGLEILGKKLREVMK